MTIKRHGGHFPDSQLLTPCRCSHDELFVRLILSIHSFRPNMIGLRVWLGDSGSMSSDISAWGDSDCMLVPIFLSTANPWVPAI
jgi:hypothetical protein